MPTTGQLSLAPWQVLLLAYLLGLLGLEHVYAAGAGLVLLAGLARPAFARPLAALLCLPVFGLGLAAAHMALPQPPSETEVGYFETHSRRLTVTGRVDEAEWLRPGLGRVLLSEVAYTGSIKGDPPPELTGRLRLTLDLRKAAGTAQLPPLPLPGEVLTAKVRLKPLHGFKNPGTFDADSYWRRQNVFYRAGLYARGPEREEREERAEPLYRLSEAPGTWNGLVRWTAKARRTLLEGVEERLRAADGSLTQGAALALALAFGERTYVADATRDLLARASLAHSMALSGLHLSFVVAFGFLLAHLAGLLRPTLYLALPRQKLGVFLALPLVLAYLWLGQGTPSLFRAALMLASFGTLLFLGRSRPLLDGLFLALALMLLADPLAALDLRLQLSALAVGGIACYLALRPLLMIRLGLTEQDGGKAGPRRLWARWLLDAFCISASAQLAALPLTAWTFGLVSLSGYLNVLWLPLLGFLALPPTLAGTALTALPDAPGAETCLSLGTVCLNTMLGGLAQLDTAGFVTAVQAPRPTWPAWIGYWLLLFWLLRRMLPRIRKDAKPCLFPRLALPLLACVLMTAPLVLAAYERAGTLRLTLLDTGQSQAVLLTTPSGANILLDGGGFGYDGFDVGERIILPTLSLNRIPSLAAVLNTHPDQDHLSGLLTPVARLRPPVFYTNGDLPAEAHARGFVTRALAKAQLSPTPLTAGDVVRLGSDADDVTLRVLHPPLNYQGSNNNRSLICLLSWRGTPLALLPGDAETHALKDLLAGLSDPAALRAPVLLLPHHGAASSYLPALYDAVAPDLALACVGYLNPWRMPNKKVRAALNRHGIPLLTTAEHGAISLTWRRGSLPRITIARDE